MPKQEIALYKEKTNCVDTITGQSPVVQPISGALLSKLGIAQKGATIIAVLMLFFASGPHPYNYYVMLRYAVFVTAAWNSFDAHKLAKPVWACLLFGTAILFNPFLPIHLSKHTWSGIDFFCSCLLLFSIFAVKK